MGYVAVQGKPLKERKFNKELVGHTTMIYFLLPLKVVTFFSFSLHTKGKNVSGKEETSKILRVKVSHLHFLKAQEKRRLMTAARLRELDKSRL